MKAAGRVLLIGILCVLLVGFGVCGAYGAVIGLMGSIGPKQFDVELFLICGGLGLAIAWLCWKAIVGLWRLPPPME